jgi:hypothetical protein
MMLNITNVLTFVTSIFTCAHDRLRHQSLGWTGTTCGSHGRRRGGWHEWLLLPLLLLLVSSLA